MLDLQRRNAGGMIKFAGDLVVAHGRSCLGIHRSQKSSTSFIIPAFAPGSVHARLDFLPLLLHAALGLIERAGMSTKLRRATGVQTLFLPLRGFDGKPVFISVAPVAQLDRASAF